MFLCMPRDALNSTLWYEVSSCSQQTVTGQDSCINIVCMSLRPKVVGCMSSNERQILWLVGLLLFKCSVHHSSTVTFIERIQPVMADDCSKQISSRTLWSFPKCLSRGRDVACIFDLRWVVGVVNAQRGTGFVGSVPPSRAEVRMVR